ncbi:hypothetical protein [Aromatoleum sp.]|uniref:hypothetical protein n=1 Tax=Aromatoleum sp. TaxID=2307007 RepID=UPI002FC8F3D2
MASRLSAAAAEFERLAPAVLGDPLAGDAGARILRQWHSLAATPAADADASRAAHEEILAGLFGLRDAVVDRSGLSLNDDVAVQTLVDLLNSQLVPLLQNLGQARDVGVGILARGRIGMSQRDAMSAVRGSFDPLLTWIAKSVERTVAIAPELAPVLAEPLGTLNAATLGIQEYLTTKLINTSDLDVPLLDYHDKGSGALDAGIAFADRLMPQLDRMLAGREAHFHSRFLWTAVMLGVTRVAAYVVVRAAMRRCRGGAARNRSPRAPAPQPRGARRDATLVREAARRQERGIPRACGGTFPLKSGRDGNGLFVLGFFVEHRCGGLGFRAARA